MIIVQYTAKFIRMYEGLEPRLRTEIKEKISLFQNKKNHILLKVHRLHGNLKNCYSFPVNYKIRVIFRYESKEIVNLMYVGAHDELYR